jgi:hypothetical protein
MKSKSLTLFSPLLVSPLSTSPSHQSRCSGILSSDGIFPLYRPCEESACRDEMEGFNQRETLLLAEQKHEIEDLKKRMKKLEDALAV